MALVKLLTVSSHDAEYLRVSIHHILCAMRSGRPDWQHTRNNLYQASWTVALCRSCASPVLLDVVAISACAPCHDDQALVTQATRGAALPCACVLARIHTHPHRKIHFVLVWPATSKGAARPVAGQPIMTNYITA